MNQVGRAVSQKLNQLRRTLVDERQPLLIFVIGKGQTNLKLFFQADVSSKKRTNKFDFTTCRLVFVRFLEESEDTNKTFQN